MKNKLDKVIACFKKLDFTPNVDKFQDRIIMQKIVFLLDQLGVKLSYPYSLYVKGPYSPQLTREIFANKESVMKLKNATNLTKKEIDIIEDFGDIIELKPTQLEIVSTYRYLIEVCDKNPQEALLLLKKLKPFFSDTDVAIGISKYKELFFKPTKKELKEMKNEFRPWELASDKDFAKGA